MTGKTRSCLAGTLLGGLLLVTAACGGGGGSKGNTAPTTHATNTGAATTTTTSSSGGNLAGLASAANCRQLSSLGAKLSAAFTGKNQDIQKEATLLKQFADRTPSDIRPDFEVLAGAYGKIANALKGLNLTAGQTPSAAQIAKLTQLSTQIDETAVAKASEHIAAWATKNCKA